MYTVDFLIDGHTVETISHPKDDEEVWLNAGFDVLEERGSPTRITESHLHYAIQALKGAPEYFRGAYGDRYLSTLRFLDDFHELCESYPDATIDVRS